MRYDHPNCIVRREASFLTTAGAAGVGARFCMFQKIKLKAVHAAVVTAGTSASTNTLIVKNGTTALGTMTLGTSTAGALVNSATLNTEIASMSVLSVTNGADVVGVAMVSYEYEVQPDAVLTV
jgi:hypothetical protein